MVVDERVRLASPLPLLGKDAIRKSDARRRPAGNRSRSAAAILSFFLHKDVVMNPLLLTSTAALAVSAIFCLYQHYRQAISRRQRQLRERVAYMLWTAANRRP